MAVVGHQPFEVDALKCIKRVKAETVIIVRHLRKLLQFVSFAITYNNRAQK